MALPVENAAVGVGSRRTSIIEDNASPSLKCYSSNYHSGKCSSSNTHPAMRRALGTQLLAAMLVMPLRKGGNMGRQTMTLKTNPKLHPRLKPIREGMLLLCIRDMIGVC